MKNTHALVLSPATPKSPTSPTAWSETADSRVQVVTLERAACDGARPGRFRHIAFVRSTTVVYVSTLHSINTPFDRCSLGCFSVYFFAVCCFVSHEVSFVVLFGTERNASLCITDGAIRPAFSGLDRARRLRQEIRGVTSKLVVPRCVSTTTATAADRNTCRKHTAAAIAAAILILRLPLVLLLFY